VGFRHAIGNLVRLNFGSESLGVVVYVEEYTPSVQRVRVRWFADSDHKETEIWTSPLDLEILGHAN